MNRFAVVPLDGAKPPNVAGDRKRLWATAWRPWWDGAARIAQYDAKISLDGKISSSLSENYRTQQGCNAGFFFDGFAADKIVPAFFKAATTAIPQFAIDND